MYAQKVDIMGAKLWAEDKLIGTQSLESKIITDGNFGAIIFWHKDPPWGPIMAQQISKYGNLGQVIVSVNEQPYYNIKQYSLGQNYPNPFNPTTKLSFVISHSSFVLLKIFDVLGREVAVLVNEERPAGKYEVEFNGRNLASGVYYYKILAGNYTKVKKMLLLR